MSDRPELVRIPAGNVLLKDRRTQTSWTAAVQAFSLAVAPVTVRQYCAVLQQPMPQDSGADCPVTEVSWREAVAFCNALSEQHGLRPVYRIEAHEVFRVEAADGYRLPSEAEWEHSCRGGTEGARYGDLDEIAWYRDNSEGRPHPVATKRPNDWGLYDMLGNVFEWCFDYYDPKVYGTYRVLKGGGWADPPWSCRAGVRRRSMDSFKIDDVGFRVARNG